MSRVAWFMNLCSRRDRNTWENLWEVFVLKRGRITHRELLCVRRVIAYTVIVERIEEVNRLPHVRRCTMWVAFLENDIM